MAKNAMKENGAGSLPVTIEIHTPTEAEVIRRNKVFMSHASVDSDRTRKLCDEMRAERLEPIWDGDIDGGDFKKRIEQMLGCRAAVLVINEDALSSAWVEYELGFLEGRGTRVLLWDPDEILSKAVDVQAIRQAAEDKKNEAVANAECPAAEEKKRRKEKKPGKSPGELLADRLKNVQLFSHMPAITGQKHLIELLRECRMYAGLYRTVLPSLGERAALSEEERLTLFEERFRERVETLAVRISADVLRERAELFRDCRIGTLIVNFGHFLKPKEEPTFAPCPPRGRSLVPSDSATPPLCFVSEGMPCARYGSRRELDRDTAECILLNHIEWSGSFRSAAAPEEGELSFYVPVHKTCGTTFKLIVDPRDEVSHWELRSLFTEMGLSPTVSDSRNSLRIYLSLPEQEKRGVFRLDKKKHFGNNFCCPYALRAMRKTL